MRRASGKRLSRDGGFGLCLLASVLLHLTLLAVMPLPNQFRAPAGTNVFLVADSRALQAGPGSRTSGRLSSPKKSLRRKASPPGASSSPVHSVPVTGQRSNCPAVEKVARQDTAKPVGDIPAPPFAGNPDDASVGGGLSSVSRGVGMETARRGVAGGEKLEEEPELGAIGAAAFLHRAIPRYPPVARRLGREGTVTLRLAIDAHGALRNVEVLRGAGYGFTEAALDALERSTFRPAVRGGRPVDSRAVLRVVFALRNH